MKKRSAENGLSWAIFISSFFFLSLIFADFGLSQKLPKKSPDLLKQGKTIYDKACALCHGPNGDGTGPLSANLKTPPANFTKPLSQWKNTRGDPNKIFNTISNGVPDTAMAKFHYSDEERWALTHTIMEFSK